MQHEKDQSTSVTIFFLRADFILMLPGALWATLFCCFLLSASVIDLLSLPACDHCQYIVVSVRVNNKRMLAALPGEQGLDTMCI